MEKGKDKTKVRVGENKCTLMRASRAGLKKAIRLLITAQRSVCVRVLIEFKQRFKNKKRQGDVFRFWKTSLLD